jgi:hypothetical protein
MVRAGVFDHPAEWIFSGYHEIQNPRERYRIIDFEKLLSLLEYDSLVDPEGGLRALLFVAA